MCTSSISINSAAAKDSIANEPLRRRSSADAWTAALAFLVGSSYVCSVYNYSNLIDEGIILQGAERILHGQVLYRDFFAFYTPGSYYLTALCFKLFGSSFLVARARLILYGGLSSFLTFIIARRHCSRWSSLLAAYLVLLCFPYCFYVQHNWDSTMLAFLAMYCVVRLLESPSSRTAFALGAFCALTFLFEQSKGAGLVAGIFLGIICAALGRWKISAIDKKYAWALSAGFAIPIFTTLSYFAFHKALLIALSDWIWPLRHYSEINMVPYGFFPLRYSSNTVLTSGSWIGRCVKYIIIAPAFIIPFIPTLATAICFLHAYRLSRGVIDKENIQFTFIGFTVVGVWLSLLATRADLAHCIFVLPLFSVALAWMIDTAGAAARFLYRVKTVAIAVVLISFSLFGVALLYNATNSSPQPTRRGAVRFPQHDEIVPYVISHVPADSNIFVYPYQPLYYYLTATVNPTKFEYLQPGLHTPRQIEEAVRELSSSNTRVMLVWPEFRQQLALSFPRTSDSAFTTLDPVRDYILTHYHVCKGLLSGPVEYWYMLRSDLECEK